MSTFHVGSIYSFTFLSFFLFIVNMKSSDSSFVAKAVNSCRNVGQDVSSELPRLVFKLWVSCREEKWLLRIHLSSLSQARGQTKGKIQTPALIKVDSTFDKGRADLREQWGQLVSAKDLELVPVLEPQKCAALLLVCYTYVLFLS